MDGWREVAPHVFQRRYQPEDVSVGAIVGPGGVTIVDTRNNPAEAEEIVDDVRTAFGLPLVAAVNTHAHYDHTYGNQVFADLGLAVYGHHFVPAHHARYEAPRLAAVQADPASEPDKDWAQVRLTSPTVLIDRPTTVDLGGVGIELIPLEPGHTDDDLAVHVPGAGAWFLGDVVEESGPPMFGSGSYPLRWGWALRDLLPRIGDDEVVVPGHGRPVDRAFVVRQADLLQQLADEIVAARSAGATEVAFSPAVRDLWPDDFLASALADAEV